MKNRFEVMNEITAMGYEVRYEDTNKYPVLNREGVQIGSLYYNSFINRFDEYGCNVAVPGNLRRYCEDNNISINRVGQIAYDEWKEVLKGEKDNI